MSYHGRIMNIPAQFDPEFGINQRLTYKLGHRAARHAAAEIANEADTVIEELLEALEMMLDMSEMCGFGKAAAEDVARAAIAKAKGEQT